MESSQVVERVVLSHYTGFWELHLTKLKQLRLTGILLKYHTESEHQGDEKSFLLVLNPNKVAFFFYCFPQKSLKQTNKQTNKNYDSFPDSAILSDEIRKWKLWSYP